MMLIINPGDIEIQKYEQELKTLKSLKSHMIHVFDARIEIVDQKISECKKEIEDREKKNDGKR